MKKYFISLAMLTLPFFANSANLTIYGHGGVVYNNGTVSVCPKPSNSKCAEVNLSTLEITDLTKNRVVTKFSEVLLIEESKDEHGNIIVTKLIVKQ